MLRQWQKLATPSFCLKTERPGILSRDGGLDNMHLLRDELFSLNDIEAEGTHTPLFLLLIILIHTQIDRQRYLCIYI